MFAIVVGCDDDSVQDDTGVSDVVTADAGDGGPSDGEAEGAVDLAPDGPRPDPEWKTIAGSPQVEDHTVTLLKNGEVLVAGGDAYDGLNSHYQDSTFRFVPSTETFVDAGKMTTQRARHTATALNDGRVLVTGGKNDVDYLQTTDIFDPAKAPAQAWTKGPDMFKSRWDHSATLLQNGEVLIAGGFYYSDSTESIVIYDPKTNAFKVPSAILHEARRAHTATLLPTGKVLFAGGIQGSGSIFTTTYLDSLEIYDPTSGAMTLSAAKMSMQRCGHSATLLASGKVLIVGGVCLNGCKANEKYVDDIYDPGTDTIAPLAHAGDLPSTHVAAKLKDNRVLVVGDVDKATYAATLAYDPQGGGFWSTLPAMAMGRWSAQGTLLDDGTVLVVGGVVESSPYTLADKAERFYP